MNAAEIKIECEEDGFHIVIDGDSIDPDYQAGRYGWKIEDPEALYNAVCSAIGPWLYEREQARREFVNGFACVPDESGGYDTSDPKHPDFHSIHADIYDNRDKTSHPRYWLGRLSTALVAPEHPKVAREALEEFVRSPVPSAQLKKTLRERMNPR